MRQISDEELVCEFIRRLRGRKLKTDSYEGANMEVVIGALKHIMDPTDITTAFSALMNSGTVTITGVVREFYSNKRPGNEWKVRGIFTNLHPDIVLDRNRFHFSLGGSLLSGARRKFPEKHCIWYSLSMCYMTEDGLPKSVQKMLKQPPVPRPVLPEYA